MCGIIGLWSEKPSREIPLQAWAGLFGLQHRGQESTGLAWLSPNENRIKLRKTTALVARGLDPIHRHEGNEGGYGESQVVIGHCRYSTSGGSGLANAQPLRAVCARGQIALAHNGNISNFAKLRNDLQHKGAIFQSTSDTEVILHMVAHRTDLSLQEALIEALKKVEGGYAIVAIVEDKLVIARDSKGIRPLVYGRLGDQWIAASETCSIEQIGGCVEGNVAPGEVLVFEKTGPKVLHQMKASCLKPCAFEYVYFARPDSLMDDHSVYDARIKLGKALARSAPAQADLVCGMPDSGRISALGFARESGLPFEEAILRNHYVGRSFMLPNQDAREQAVRQKLRPVSNRLKGKSIVVVDDSIVRGTTSRYVINMLKAAGAREVHMRIASPPVQFPCFYGIDMPDRSELAAAHSSEEELCEAIGADSLKWLLLEDLETSIGMPDLCKACFTGNYLWENSDEQ